jgi:hypothetical protein
MSLIRDILGLMGKKTHLGYFSLWSIEDINILFPPIIEPHSIKNLESQVKLNISEYRIYKLIRMMS